MNSPKFYSLEGALKAQKPLRERNRSDTGIASLIKQNSAIEITAAEIAEHYAPPEHRHWRGAQLRPLLESSYGFQSRRRWFHIPSLRHFHLCCGFHIRS